MLKRPPELVRVPTHCRKHREMAFPWKIREISGNLPSSSGNFWKQQNLRQFSGNIYGRFKCCFGECYVVFHMFFPSVSKQNHWKNKAFTNSPIVNTCNVYLPMVNRIWWLYRSTLVEVILKISSANWPLGSGITGPYKYTGNHTHLGLKNNWGMQS